LAAGCLGALGPPAVAILIATNFGDIATGTFVLYKAILGITLGAIVTPMIALHAMADTRPSTEDDSRSLCNTATGERVRV
jgi:hypothetical protein